MWIRLRQIAVACTDLNLVSRDLTSVLGLEACFTDPGVKQFGLKNTLWPVGTQFLECVTPLTSDLNATAAGRYIERKKGDTGYMVICEVDDVARRKAVVNELGIRVAFDLDYPKEGHVGIQLHPGDTGGSFLEMDEMTMDGGGEVGGPWWPAGPNWQPYVRTERVDAISAATISSPDPVTLASRWAEITQVPFDLDDHNQPILDFDNARLRFVEEEDGRGERLSGIDVRCCDRPSVLATAETLGLRIDDETVALAGLHVTCIE